MSPTATQRRPTTRRKKKADVPAWMTWWPLVLGILITPVTVRAAGVMALAGPQALRMLYPWVQLMQNQAFPVEVAGTVSQAMMYLQFPVYGLLMSMVLRAKGFRLALLAAAIAHFGAVGVLMALR